MLSVVLSGAQLNESNTTLFSLTNYDNNLTIGNMVKPRSTVK